MSVHNFYNFVTVDTANMIAKKNQCFVIIKIQVNFGLRRDLDAGYPSETGTLRTELPGPGLSNERELHKLQDYSKTNFFGVYWSDQFGRADVLSFTPRGNVIFAIKFYRCKLIQNVRVALHPKPPG